MPAARKYCRTAGEGHGRTARVYVTEESDSGISGIPFAPWRLWPGMVRVFLLGCPLHSGIAGMPRLVFCRAGLIVDKLGVQL
jgi:hypothetical protein